MANKKKVEIPQGGAELERNYEQEEGEKDGEKRN